MGGSGWIWTDLGGRREGEREESRGEEDLPSEMDERGCDFRKLCGVLNERGCNFKRLGGVLNERG